MVKVVEDIKASSVIKKDAIRKMLESLIGGNSNEAGEHLHDYLRIKTRELIIGESDDKSKDDDDKSKDDDDDDKKSKDDDDDDKSKDDDDKKSKDDDDDKKSKDDDKKVNEQHRSSAFARSGSVMSDKISGKVKFENGGKKTLKKHGNAAKELDDDKVDKTKFKSGGKQPARTLEKTPKPEKFNDGRDKDLGTTKA